MEDYCTAHPLRRTAALVTVCFAALLLLSATTSARANGPQDVWQSYQITAGDIPSALVRFGQQSGVKILFDYVALEKFNTKGVDGAYTSSEALTHILEGTDLRYDWINDETVVVKPKRPTPKGP